jgi:hypothetical protein
MMLLCRLLVGFVVGFVVGQVVLGEMPWWVVFVCSRLRGVAVVVCLSIGLFLFESLWFDAESLEKLADLLCREVCEAYYW